MASSEFDITIGDDGAVELRCHGFNAHACLNAVKIFEKMAGEITSPPPATGFDVSARHAPDPSKNVGSFGQTLL